MVKKEEIKTLEKYAKICVILGTMFLLIWFSSKSIVYSMEHKVPQLYVITKGRVTNADILKKATNLDSLNYFCPVEYVEKYDIPYVKVEKGEEIELQTEKLASVKPEKIKKENIYLKQFKNMDKDSMQDAEITSAEIENISKIKIKAPEEVGDYIYQLVVKYNNKSIDYVFRVKVGE